VSRSAGMASHSAVGSRESGFENEIARLES
jgi:hypothetical protein